MFIIIFINEPVTIYSIIMIFAQATITHAINYIIYANDLILFVYFNHYHANIIADVRLLYKLYFEFFIFVSFFIGKISWGHITPVRMVGRLD